jgi:CBS domain-containing membrane protein
MTNRVASVGSGDSLALAEELMEVERIRHLPVVDGDVLVGLLSQRDLVAASISTLNNPSDEDDLERKRRVPVSEIMRGSVETVRPEDDVIVAADKLLEQKLGSLPVVDERDRLVGMLTESDFVRLVRARLVEERDHARRAPPRRASGAR